MDPGQFQPSAVYFGALYLVTGHQKDQLFHKIKRKEIAQYFLYCAISFLVRINKCCIIT